MSAVIRMSVSRAASRWGSAILLAVCVGLIIPLPAYLRPPAPLAVAPGAYPPLDTAQVELPATPPLSDYSELTERPLFSRTRRAVSGNSQEPPPQPIATTPVGAPDFRLSAIVIAGEQRIALLQPLAGGLAEPQRLSPGEHYQDWEVLEVHPRSVILRRNGQRHTLALESTATPEPLAPPSAEPPADLPDTSGI